jgi:hypothetical protein
MPENWNSHQSLNQIAHIALNLYYNYFPPKYHGSCDKIYILYLWLFWPTFFLQPYYFHTDGCVEDW